MTHLLLSGIFINSEQLALDFAAGELKRQNGPQSTPQEYVQSGQILLYPQTEKNRDTSGSFLQYFTRRSQKSILILGSLSEFSLNMQQAMLKFIEEPPANLEIILTARTRSEVLPTILSRCRVHFIPFPITQRFIDKEKNDELTAHFPDCKIAAAALLTGKRVVEPDFKKISREGMEIWLFKVELYLEQILLKDQNLIQLCANGRKAMHCITAARSLNSANVLNRLVWARLNL